MPTCLGQRKFRTFSYVKQGVMAVRNFCLDFALMKIILQDCVWDNLAFIMGHANVTFLQVVPNSIKDTVTLQQ